METTAHDSGTKLASFVDLDSAQSYAHYKMEIIMEEEIERFDAVAENDDIFTIICYERTNTYTTLVGGTQRTSGTIRYETSSGLPVNACKDSNKFEIVQTDQIVHRV